jgi:hypothetical protein
MTSLSPDSEPSIPPPMRHIQTIAYTLPPPTGPGNLLSSSAAVKALAELLTRMPVNVPTNHVMEALKQLILWPAD